jgi:uncharacterized protein with von Willebrand factor type A (vWA) domain
MSAIISAIDKHTPVQVGENGHQEYGWSNDYREKVVQLSFQLTRTQNYDGLETQLHYLLGGLRQENELIAPAERKELLVTLYKMIGHTRDIIDGKGEYNLTYMLIYTWYQFYPELAKYALLSCVVPEHDEATGKHKREHPYGSWKDIKYFCNFCKDKGCDISHPLIIYALELVNQQLKIDQEALAAGKANEISLLCKWITREKSAKFGWMYQALAETFFTDYIFSANNVQAHKKAVTKAKMDYRKVIAGLNRALDTTQIKQCAGEWSEINFNKTTSITIAKQKKAFLNVTKKGIERSQKEDRVQCANNFKEHIAKAVKGEQEVKGKRVGLNTFTQQALSLIYEFSNPNKQVEIDLLNSQWRDNASQNGQLENFVAMVDVSGSMEGDPMHAAIALGYRVAEKSTIGKRIMTFSATPSWVNLDGCPDFVSAVALIRKAPWGMNTNFHAALDMILNACVEQKLDPELVAKMVLAIFSDMQVDEASNESMGSLYSVMEEKYRDAGMRAVGKPYQPPHILFWNLRTTSGFPSISTQKNVSMMSGFSPVLLNLFCEKGMDAFLSCTPWSTLMESLNNPRYLRLETTALKAL